MKRIVEFMKRNYKVILLITALSAILWSFVPSEKKEDPENDKLLLELLTFVLEKGHFSPIEINDEFSKKGTKVYLEIRGKKYPANICGLPFYKKSYVKGANQ